MKRRRTRKPPTPRLGGGRPGISTDDPSFALLLGREDNDGDDDDDGGYGYGAWLWYLLPVALAWRIYLAVHMPVMDCDEVYNYWEPLHYMVFGNTSDAPPALQTWEYANQYALRSYAFLLPLKAVGHLYLYLVHGLRNSASSSPIASGANDLLRAWFVPLPRDASSTRVLHGDSTNNNDDSILLFFLLRATVAVATTLAETYWFRTLLQQTSRPLVVPRRVVIVLAVLALSLPGTNMVSVSLLPSCAYSVGWLVASALLVRHQFKAVVMTAILCTLTTGWPFGAAVFAPMAIRIIWLQYYQGGYGQVLKLAGFGLTMALLVQLVVCAVDGYYYHDDYLHSWTTLPPVLATWNIFKYNAVGGGDTMYGVEPLAYYVKNLLINLNVVAPLGLMAVLVHGCSQRVNWDLWSCLFSIIPWILITFPRPHKEERFLFPMYPALVTGAAMVVDATFNALGRLEAGLSRHKCLSRKQRLVLELIVWGPAVLLGLSRTVALTKYYSAPLAAYAALSARVGPHDAVCTCGEWYRYPSTFFLGNTDQPLHFLPSSFVGQLPQPFARSGSRPSSLVDLQPFRSDNGMNPERFSTLNDCDWVVELKSGTGDCNVTLPDDEAAIVYRHPFLDAAATTSTLHRVLYVPRSHEAAVQKGSVLYHEYVVYQIKKP